MTTEQIESQLVKLRKKYLAIKDSEDVGDMLDTRILVIRGKLLRSALEKKNKRGLFA